MLLFVWSSPCRLRTRNGVRNCIVATNLSPRTISEFARQLSRYRRSLSSIDEISFAPVKDVLPYGMNRASQLSAPMPWYF